MFRYTLLTVVYLTLFVGSKQALSQDYEVRCGDSKKLIGYESINQGNYEFILLNEDHFYTHTSDDQDSGSFNENGVWHETFFYTKDIQKTGDIVQDKLELTLDVFGKASIKTNSNYFKNCLVS